MTDKAPAEPMVSCDWESALFRINGDQPDYEISIPPRGFPLGGILVQIPYTMTIAQAEYLRWCGTFSMHDTDLDSGKEILWMHVPLVRVLSSGPSLDPSLMSEDGSPKLHPSWQNAIKATRHVRILGGDGRAIIEFRDKEEDLDEDGLEIVKPKLFKWEGFPGELAIRIQAHGEVSKKVFEKLKEKYS